MRGPPVLKRQAIVGCPSGTLHIAHGRRKLSIQLQQALFVDERGAFADSAATARSSAMAEFDRNAFGHGIWTLFENRSVSPDDAPGDRGSETVPRRTRRIMAAATRR